MNEGKLKEYIKSIVKEIIEEESVSGDAGAYSTPLAFKPPSNAVSSIKENFKKIDKAILKEITYGKFKNEVRLRSKNEVLNKAIREVKHKLNEVNRLIDYTIRMKTELSESEGGLQAWKRTEENVKQVKEMLSNVSTKLANL
jgi:hypothetical protein